MQNLMLFRPARPASLPVLGALVIGFVWPLVGAAQNTPPDPTAHQHAGRPADADKDLPTQLRELKAKAAALEAALEQRYPAAIAKGTADGNGTSPMSGGMSMMGGIGMSGGSGGDDDMAEMMKMMRIMMEMKMMQMKEKGQGMMGDEMMGGMGGKQTGMSGMGSMMDMMMGGGMEGMRKLDDGMDMMGMMGKGGMGGKGMQMKMAAALPGFPGASHIYHIGATGFFLDHPDHIQLTSEQRIALNGIKEKALLEQATMQRQIDEAEQQLWTSTASDEPDAEKIDAKVREIEKLRGDQRIAFIRAVGEAAKVLTAAQRQALVSGN